MHKSPINTRRFQSNSTVQRCPMYEERGKYYADWRDAKGVRHRKSFESESLALAYEEAQKAMRRGKKTGQRERNSVNSLAPSRRRKSQQTDGRGSSSSASSGGSNRRVSGRSTSTSSTRGSSPALDQGSRGKRERRPSVSYSSFSGKTAGLRSSMNESSSRQRLNRVTSPPRKRKG
jgi:hypothetical protein